MRSPRTWILWLGLLAIGVLACTAPAAAGTAIPPSDTPAGQACANPPDPLVSVNQANWQQVLSCPTSASQTLQYDWMPFEHGSMLHHPLSSIFVLFEDGTFIRYDDLPPVSGDSNPSLVAPQGLFKPDGIFGAIWYAHPELQTRLGWATTPASTYNGLDQQFLDHGARVVVLGNGDLIALFPFSSQWNKLPVGKIPGYYGGIPATPFAGVLTFGGVGLVVGVGLFTLRRRRPA